MQGDIAWQQPVAFQPLGHYDDITIPAHQNREIRVLLIGVYDINASPSRLYVYTPLNAEACAVSACLLISSCTT